MKLKRIRIKNIRSYENQEIEFPNGSLLLSGDIGSGKTSILLAIEYALFGLQPGQKGSSLLRNEAHSAEVTLELEVDGREIIIERRLKREAKSVTNDYSAITIDGEKREYSVTELKTKILEILKYPSEFVKKNNVLYRYTVYTPQEQMKQIILEEPETRLNILGYVFGIDKYKRIRENLTTFLNRLKEETKILQLEIKFLDEEKLKIISEQTRLTTLLSEIDKKKTEVQDLIAKRKSIETQLKALESKIKEKEVFEREVEKTKIMVGSKKDSLATLNKEFENLQRSLSEEDVIFNEDRMNALSKLISSKKEEIENVNERYIDLCSKLRNIEQNKSKLVEKKERIFHMDMCQSCLQNVPHAHKHNILNATEKELAEIEKYLFSLKEEQKEAKSLLDKNRLELPRLEEEKLSMEILKSKVFFIERSKKRLGEISKSRSELEKDLSLLSSHMGKLKQSILEFSKFNNQFKLVSDNLSQAFRHEKIAEISLAELRKEFELTANHIDNMSRAIDEKEKSKKRLSDLLALTDWLSNHFVNVVNYIERNVMIQLRVEFTRLFSKWFGVLAGDSFEVRLDENFTPLIIQGDIEMDYSFLSGGERTAIALAYRLALNQTINSLLSNLKTKDLIILDEPTEGFSETQLDKMREVLSELNIPQMIIVSHEQKMESFVENILRLKKEQNQSSVQSPENQNA